MTLPWQTLVVIVFTMAAPVEIDPSSGVKYPGSQIELPADISVHDFYDIDIDEDDILRVTSPSSTLIYRYNLNGTLLSSQSIDVFLIQVGFKAISYVK